MKSNSRGTALRGNERLMGHNHGKNMFKTLKRTKKATFSWPSWINDVSLHNGAAVFNLEATTHLQVNQVNMFWLFLHPKANYYYYPFKRCIFLFSYNYRVSSWTNCGDIFRARTQTSALWRSHGCFGLYEVARWHIKSRMCREGHVLAMRRRGGVAGIQTFEKTTGKNRPRIDLDVQHNWAPVFADFCSMHSKKEHGHRIKEQECVQECLSVLNLDLVVL